MWALIRKETLENIRWLPLALLVTGAVAVASLYQGWLEEVGPFTGSMVIASGLLSVAMALLQSIPDQRNGARAYLLHRGVSADEVFWAKSLVGFGLLFVSIAIPLLASALWLSVRGVLNAPGRPYQMWGPAALSISGFLYYPVVMLIIYRPARWLGSRVLPIVVPVAVQVISVPMAVNNQGGLRTFVYLAVFALVVLIPLMLAARLAYTKLAEQPPANAKAHRSPAVALTVIFSMLVVTSMIAATIGVFDQALRPPRHGFYSVVVNKNDGHMWLTYVEQRWSKENSGYEMNYLSGAPLVADVVPDVNATLPANFAAQYPTPLVAERSYGDIAYMRVVGATTEGRWITIGDRRGYLLCYQQLVTPGVDRLGQVISRDGIHDPKGDWGQPFDGPFSVDGSSRRLGIVGDKHGLYQVDETDGNVWPLIERPIQAVQLSEKLDEPLQVFVRSGSKVAIYNLNDEAGAIQVSMKNGAIDVSGRMTATLIDEFELPERVAKLSYLGLYYRGINDWVVHGQGGVGAYAVGSVAERTPTQSQAESFTVTAPPSIYSIPLRDVQLASVFAMPLPALGSIQLYFTQGRSQHKSLAEVTSVPIEWLPWIIGMFLLQGAIAALLTWRAAVHRGLSRIAIYVWMVIAMAFGWAVPLAVLACYPRLVREPCSHCQKPRRVDLLRCEHCHADWERSQREGIEIIEHEFDRMGAEAV